jgi:RsiW-degrading membrane proteinase PrsW (M82 family)
MDSATAIMVCILLGFLPMLFFAWIIYWVDRYEKEPKILLGVVFLWGAVVAAGVAFFINTLLGVGIYMFTGSEAIAELTTGSLIAPIIEECLKGFAVVIVFLVFRREFDSILDGIVYAAVAALGFAATENAYYIYAYGYTEQGLSGILVMTFIRVGLVGWQHPFYTSFTGIGLAVARLNRSSAVKFIAPLAGLSIGITAHALHNTIASFLSGLGGLAASTLLDWTGWFFMFLFIIWALYREQRWIVTHLKEEVERGTLTTHQYRTACSAWAQSFTRLSALFSGRYRLTNRFYQLTAELAYKKQQHAQFGEEKGNTVIIENLRKELTQLSTRLAA